MKRLLLLMSHNITEIQEKEAYEVLKINQIINSSEEVKSIWSNIDPKGELNLHKLDKIIDWIDENTSQGDYILVQGEFGATFYIVDYCFKKNLIPIYATSKRQVIETIVGDKTVTNRVFKHEGFRRYIRYTK